MQTISQNVITQGKHGQFNAVDIGPFPDPYWYAPEDCVVTLIDTVDDDTCGRRIKFTGATGEHGVCHNERFYVKVGDKVKRGQKMAKMGYTGLTEPDNVPAGTHAHWILNVNGNWVYPPSRVNQAFIKGGEEMVTSLGLSTVTRLLCGREPSATEKKNFIGKFTFDETFNKFLVSPEHKERIKLIKKAKGDLNNHLPADMRS